MKIGVISDIHSYSVPEEILKAFKDVDLIIHAGDFCRLSDYNAWKKLKNVKAVYGNMDEEALRKQLPEQDIFTIENWKIGLFQGEGPPKKVFEGVKERFKNEKCRIVIFGHSHQPLKEEVGGTLYFNPGSPTDRICAPCRAYGLMEITPQSVKAEIIHLSESEDKKNPFVK